MKNYYHVPVMLNEVMNFLNVKKGGYYIDGTLGGGSYSKFISERIGSDGLLMSIDLDPLAIENFLKDKPKNVEVVNDNFSNLSNIVHDSKIFNDRLKKVNFKFDGIVVDLGLSSAQLDDENRGFSFLRDGYLDMSFGPKSSNDTTWIVNNYRPADLERIIKEYGEESWAKKITEHLINYRKKKKITSTKELAEIVAGAIPKKFWYKNIHPATKTFQALRIETNEELNVLKEFLPVAIELLKSNGRLVIVSFHSLEDRIVKNFFRNLKKSDDKIIEILTPKPVVSSQKEIEENHRSRSAKLRAIKKI